MLNNNETKASIYRRFKVSKHSLWRFINNNITLKNNGLYVYKNIKKIQQLEATKKAQKINQLQQLKQGLKNN
jgi:hypothetical protein